MSHAAFWKAVCADPDDDTPRLVYADWLDEQGDPASVDRAEFIRAQIELVQLDPWTGRAIDLKARESLLLRDRRHEWLERLPKWIDRVTVTFRRGMPHGMHCRARQYLKNAGGVAKNTPIQELRLAGLDMDLARQLAELPHLGRWREFQPLGDGWASWATVLASPHLTGLRALSLRDQGHAVPLSELRDILHLPAVRGVQRLHLHVSERHAGSSAEALRALARAPLADLRELDLLAEELHPLRLAEVFDSPVADRLAAFRTVQYLGDHALGGFVRAGERSRLKAIAFAVVHSSQEQLPAVFASPLFRHVESLEVGYLRAEGFRALAASGVAERLRVLRLSRSDSGGAEYREAFDSGRFANVLELGVPAWRGERQAFGEASALTAVANTTGLPNLRHLILSGGEIDLDVLAASRHLPNLRAVTVPRQFPGVALYDPARLKEFAAKYAGRFEVLV